MITDLINNYLITIDSESDLPEPGEEVIFLLEIKSTASGKLEHKLETYIGFLSEDNYGLGGDIYVSEFIDDGKDGYFESVETGWTVEKGTQYLRPTKIDY